MSETNIGPGITVDGEITGDDSVVVEGTVKGVIDTEDTVTVAEDGVVEADIESEDVQVHGRIEGTIRAGERAELAPEGRMLGDIVAPRIHIADGANFKGHIDMDLGGE
jgi:cytoskeletal protein CcmA (bactofilin family)